MAAQLCRRLLLADPTRHLPRVVAAASFSTPPNHLFTRVAAASPPTLHTHCATSPPSAASMRASGSSSSSLADPTHSLSLIAAASLSERPMHLLTRVAAAAMSASSRSSAVLSPATRSPPSIGSRISAVPSPATCSPPIGSCTCAVPSPAVLKLGDSSARTPPPHLSSGPHCMLALTSVKVKGRAQSPFFLLHRRRFSSDQKQLPLSRPPPISQLDDSLISGEEWVELTDYLQHHSLVEDARENHLNMEVVGFGVKAKYNLSEETGIPLFQNLVLLALANNNRGYCIKKSFTKENLLVCARLKQIKLKSVIYDELKSGINDCNRQASYVAVGSLIRDLLKANVGPNVIRELLEEPRDLLCKLERPSDERLIVYHPAFLSMDGRLWYYEKLYRLVFKLLPSDRFNKKQSDFAVADMAYTDGNILIFEIISSHPLLAHIESDASDEAGKPDVSEGPEGKSSKHKKRNLGRKVVALHRDTIEHAFDKDARNIPSKQLSRMNLWPYSINHVVNFLKSVMPLYLLKSQENFLKFGLWDFLNIDSFWTRDLNWIGGVPAPSKEEQKAIDALSYGRRRLQARKFD